MVGSGPPVGSTEALVMAEVCGPGHNCMVVLVQSMGAADAQDHVEAPLPRAVEGKKGKQQCWGLLA